MLSTPSAHAIAFLWSIPAPAVAVSEPSLQGSCGPIFPQRDLHPDGQVDCLRRRCQAHPWCSADRVQPLASLPCAPTWDLPLQGRLPRKLDRRSRHICRRPKVEDIPLAQARRSVGQVKNCLASGSTSNSVTAYSVPIAAATSRLRRCNEILRRATPSAIPAKANKVATAGCKNTTSREWATVVITKHIYLNHATIPRMVY
jgi:hypothetical protein